MCSRQNRTTSPRISVPIKEFKSSKHEAVWVQIKESKGPDLVVGAYYRTPKQDSETFEDFLAIVNDATRLTKGTVLLGGDFNLPDIDWQNHIKKPKVTHTQYIVIKS